MKNFGFNLLASAQGVIGQQEYQLVKWIGTTTNANGYDIDQYADPITRKAGVYPLDRKNIAENGLEFGKEYIQIFDTGLIGLLSAGKNADKLIFNGYEYEALPSQNDWNVSGGWNQVTAVKKGLYNA